MLRIKALGRLVVLGDGAPITGSAVQPRRLALLAVIARAGARGVTRARIIEILWPESDEEHGRAVLSKALSALRRDLGSENVFHGTNNDLRLNSAVIGTDLDDFGAAILAGQLADAAALYAGPFLDGFRVADAVEFERWATAERAVLETQYIGVIGELARSAASRGDHVEAVRRWRELAAYQPLDTSHAVGLMNALVAAGEPRAAMDHARLYEGQVAASLGVPADRAVIELADRIRADVAPPPRRRVWSGRVRMVAGLGVAVVAVGAAAMWGRGARSPVQRPRVAIGRIVDQRAAGAIPVADSVIATLSANLRVDGTVEVIDVDHARNVLSSLADGADLQGAMVASARSAGAGELIDGALYGTTDGGLRLDLRRTDLRRGALLALRSSSALNATALADSAAVHLIKALGGRDTRRSFAAHRSYDAGLDAFYRGDRSTAAASFVSAVDTDSTSVMAAYYAAVATINADTTRTHRFRRALALATTAPDVERLTVNAAWAYETASPALSALADSMVRIAPRDAVGHLFVARALIARQRPLDARVSLERAIALDAVEPARAACVGCDALETLVSIYVRADSLAAAARAAHAWVRLVPASTAARARLGEILAR